MQDYDSSLTKRLPKKLKTAKTSEYMDISGSGKVEGMSGNLLSSTQKKSSKKKLKEIVSKEALIMPKMDIKGVFNKKEEEEEEEEEGATSNRRELEERNNEMAKKMLEMMRLKSRIKEGKSIKGMK